MYVQNYSDNFFSCFFIFLIYFFPLKAIYIFSKGSELIFNSKAKKEYYHLEFILLKLTENYN